MAGNADDIELEDLTRERETQQAAEEEEEEETSFNHGDKSILIIDGSNSVFTRVDDDGPSTSGIPDAKRDARDMRIALTYDKKRVLKDELGVTINKTDGPNSALIYGKLEFRFNEKTGKATGASYDGKELLVLRNGKLDYSKRTSESFINNFKELLKKAEAEHQKTPTPIAEKRAEVDLTQNVVDSIMENVDDRIDSEINRRFEEISSSTEITNNELRELRASLFDNEKLIVDNMDLREDKIKALGTEMDHWKKDKAKAEGENKKALLYDAMRKAAE